MRAKRTLGDLVASVDPSDTHGGAREGANQYTVKDEKSKEGNSLSANKRKDGGAKSPERIIARLKRDAATDTHAAALLGSIEAGDIKPYRAAIDMGWVKPPSLAPIRSLVPSGQATPHLGIAQNTHRAQRPIDGLMTPRVFRSVFARQKKRPEPLLIQAFWIGANKGASLYCSITDNKKPDLMQLKPGLVQLEIEIAYHCRRRKGLGGPFLTVTPAITGLVVVMIIVVFALPV